jgi:hypothetical protein
MKPCPKCGCQYQRLAFAIRPGDTLVALACFNRTCDYTGPFVGPITFPPDRRDGDRAAVAWDAEITRRSLPAFLRRRLPIRPGADAADYDKSEYVKPAAAMH